MIAVLSVFVLLLSRNSRYDRFGGEYEAANTPYFQAPPPGTLPPAPSGPGAVTYIANNTLQFGTWKIWADEGSFNIINLAFGTVYRIWGDKKTSWEVWNSEIKAPGGEPDYFHMETFSFGCNRIEFLIQSRLTGKSLAFDAVQNARSHWYSRWATWMEGTLSVRNGSPQHYNVGYPKIVMFGTVWTMSDMKDRLIIECQKTNSRWVFKSDGSTEWQ